MSLRVDLDYEIHCLFGEGLQHLPQQNHNRLLLVYFVLFGVVVADFADFADFVVVVADIVCVLAVDSFSEKFKTEILLNR